MDNEKDLLQNEENNTEETNKETIESAVEETECVEEFGEVSEKPAAEVSKKIYCCEACGTLTDSENCPKCQKTMTSDEAYICKKQTEVERTRKTIKTAVIAALIVVILAVGVLFVLHIHNKNLYNKGEYKELAFGQTIGEMAEEEGMLFDKYLEEHGYPENMSEATYYYVALQNRTLGDICDEESIKMYYGMTIDEYLEEMFESVELEDKGFDKDTLYGEFSGEMKLKYFLGVESEEDIEDFKEANPQFADIEMTPDMTFKEIRTAFYKAEESERVKDEEEENNYSADTEDEEADDTDEAVNDESSVVEEAQNETADVEELPAENTEEIQADAE